MRQQRHEPWIDWGLRRGLKHERRLEEDERKPEGEFIVKTVLRNEFGVRNNGENVSTRSSGHYSANPIDRVATTRPTHSTELSFQNVTGLCSYVTTRSSRPCTRLLPLNQVATTRLIHSTELACQYATGPKSLDRVATTRSTHSTESCIPGCYWTWLLRCHLTESLLLDQPTRPSHALPDATGLGSFVATRLSRSYSTNPLA